MACYVDNIQQYDPAVINPEARRHGYRWCHLTADTMKELLAMGRRLRLSASYLQRGGSQKIPHFDLTPGKRQLAIRYGAIETTTPDMMARYDPKIFFNH